MKKTYGLFLGERDEALSWVQIGRGYQTGARVRADRLGRRFGAKLYVPPCVLLVDGDTHAPRCPTFNHAMGEMA